MRIAFLIAVLALALTGCNRSLSFEEAVQRANDKPSAATVDTANMQVTASGLRYRVVKASADPNLPTALPTDTVRVHYEGKLTNGKVFDSSFKRGQPAEFPVSGVIAGWTEALQLMRPGDEYELVIPSDLAYGERGAGDVIGPNQTLVFRVQLLAIQRDGQVIRAPASK